MKKITPRANERKPLSPSREAIALDVFSLLPKQRTFTLSIYFMRERIASNLGITLTQAARAIDDLKEQDMIERANDAALVWRRVDAESEAA
jgi:DNA-binding MarR family transcriptional regulator